MTLCLNSVFNDDEKTIAFRAHKNIFYLIVNKKRKKNVNWTQNANGGAPEFSDVEN